MTRWSAESERPSNIRELRCSIKCRQLQHIHSKLFAAQTAASVRIRHLAKPAALGCPAAATMQQLSVSTRASRVLLQPRRAPPVAGGRAIAAPRRPSVAARYRESGAHGAARALQRAAGRGRQQPCTPWRRCCGPGPRLMSRAVTRHRAAAPQAPRTAAPHPSLRASPPPPHSRHPLSGPVVRSTGRHCPASHTHTPPRTHPSVPPNTQNRPRRRARRGE